MGTKKIKPVKTMKRSLPPDMEFSESLKYWLEIYSRHLIAGVVIVLLVVASILGYQYHQRNKEMRAHDAYAVVLNTWPWESPEAVGWERFIAVSSEFLQEHGSTKAALHARLDLARAHYAMGNYDEAHGLAMEAAAKISDRHPMKPLVVYQLALISRQMGMVDEAVAHWQSLQRMGGPGMQREAHWQIARIHLERQNFEEALEHFQRALDSRGEYPREELIRQELAAAQAGVGGAS